MNIELIRRLEKEAHDKVWNADVNSEDFPNSFNVEFAELIINKCLDIVEDERHNAEVLTSNPMQSCAIIDVKLNIKKYFGVK